MALITGGMGGLGMVASYEHAMAGRERIIAVTRSAYMTPGEQEAHLLDVIQDISTHYIIRCDIADAGAWSDTLAFANNIGASEDYDAEASMKDAQTQLKEMDSLDVIDVLVASLRGMIEAGSPIDMAKMNRVLYFRNNMSRGLKETMEKVRSQPLDRDTQERLYQFQEGLRELSELIELFRKRGLVEERPGAADAGSGGGLFPGEAAAAAGPGRGVQAERPCPSADGAASAAGGGGGGADRSSLLERVERELAPQRKPPPAEQGAAMGFLSGLDGTGDIVPGQTLARGEAPGSRGAPRAEPPRASGGPAAAASPAAAAAPPPPAPVACEGCGKECASSCARCSECQRSAERGSLEGAIRRAKEEARLKAQRDAERRAQRDEAEQRARRQAEQSAKEAAERLAKEEAEQRAREEAERRAKEEARRRAAEAAAREASEEAARQDAERLVREEAERKALDDVVCPAGHALERFVAMAGFPCDLCGVESVDGAAMWGCRNKGARDCRTCDFDVCGPCAGARRRRALRAQGQAV